MSSETATEEGPKVKLISYIVLIIILVAACYYIYIKYKKNKNDNDSDSDEEDIESSKDKKNKDAFNIEEEVANLNKMQAQIISQLQSKNSFGRP